MYRDQNVNRLKELGIYKEWKRNTLKDRGLKKLNEILSECETTSSIIMKGFNWRESKEKSIFWITVYCNQTDFENEINTKETEDDKTRED